MAGDSSFSIEKIFNHIDITVFQDISLEKTGKSVKEWLTLLFHGNWDEIGKGIFQQAEQVFMEAFGNAAEDSLQLFLFVILSSIVSLFALSVAEEKVHDAIFLVIYLLFFSSGCLLIQEYITMAQSFLTNILDMVQLLFSAWMISVSSLSGVLTMQTSYGVGYFCILMLEKGITKIMPPAIYSYAFLCFTGNMQKKNNLSSFSDFIKSGYDGLLKGVLFCVTGVQMFQNMFLPFFDSFTKNAAGKILSGLPGIGQGVETTLQMTYSAFSLIKNSLGAVFILLLVIVSIEPLIHFAAFYLMFRLGMIIFQPIAQPQLLQGLQTICHCCVMILKTLLMIVFLFLLMISLICSATNIAYYVT